MTESPGIQTTVSEQTEPDGYWNLQIKTLGGMQFWSDVRCVGGWKIQRNSNTGHHRLIDVGTVRQAWGDLDHCNERLDNQIKSGSVTPLTGKIVIALHGLMRTSNSMTTMQNRLRSNGYSVIRFQYASSRKTVEVHAMDLKSVISGLGDGVTEINFVGHSLGNIVVRHYVNDTNLSGIGPDPRINRMVMLGPPNQGSAMARVLKNSFLFKTIAGASGAQLSIGWRQLEPNLAIPAFEFGIIAGGQSNDSDMSNFILKGKDDFTVSLQEAKLAGADDLFVRPLLHSTMMNQPEVLAATIEFLQNGYFVSADQRNSIPESWQPVPVSPSSK